MNELKEVNKRLDIIDSLAYHQANDNVYASIKQHIGKVREHINRPSPVDGLMEGYVVMPSQLTAENGAKYLLTGEFFTPDKRGNEVPVSWTTIKEIYAKIVGYYSSSPPVDSGLMALNEWLEDGMRSIRSVTTSDDADTYEHWEVFSYGESESDIAIEGIGDSPIKAIIDAGFKASPPVDSGLDELGFYFANQIPVKTLPDGYYIKTEGDSETGESYLGWTFLENTTTNDLDEQTCYFGAFKSERVDIVPTPSRLRERVEGLVKEWDEAGFQFATNRLKQFLADSPTAPVERSVGLIGKNLSTEAGREIWKMADKAGEGAPSWVLDTIDESTTRQAERIQDSRFVSEKPIGEECEHNWFGVPTMRQCSKCHCVEIVGAIDYRPISSGAVHDARHFAYHPVAGTTANTGPISSGTFKPDWASAPGETILDILQERKISQDEFGVMIGRPAVFVNRLISGEQPINKGLAKTLARFLGATPDFWLNRDASYVESLRRINVSPTRYSEPLIKSKE